MAFKYILVLNNTSDELLNHRSKPSEKKEEEKLTILIRMVRIVLFK